MCKRHGKDLLLTADGVAVRYLTKNLNILVNLSTLPYNNKYRFQKEVIVISDGIFRIEKKDLIYHHWRSMPKESFCSEREDVEFLKSS